jgi:hypothetical protein
MWKLFIFKSTKEDRGNIVINLMLFIFYTWLILIPLGLWKIFDIVFILINYCQTI